MRFLLIALFLSSFLFAATRSLDDLAIRSGKYFLIAKTLDVPAGDTLTIGEGSEVLFPPFSGITLSGGVLFAKGTRTAPIFFTSVRDTNASAAPFDWIGIDIKPGSFAHFTYCAVSYSTSGITSADSSGLLLDSCIFYTNGQYGLSLAGTISQVPDSLPFSFSSLAQPVTGPFSSVNSAVLVDSPKKISVRTKILATFGIISIFAGSYFLIEAKSNEDNYNAFVPGNPAFDVLSPENRQQKFNYYRENYNKYSILAGTCFGLVIIDGLWFLLGTNRNNRSLECPKP